MKLIIMVYCKKCGIEISETQYSNFNGMCPECVRLTPLQRKAEFERKSGKAAWYFMGIVCIASIIWVMILLFFMR